MKILLCVKKGLVIQLIVLNEKEYAEECLKNKAISTKPFYTLSILAKYYYHVCGYRKKKIASLLIDFMEKYYPRYDCNKLDWDNSIEKIAANAGKYDLFEIDGVWVTEGELKVIEELHNKVLERLAFTMLCLAKLNNMRAPNNNGWVNYSAKDIFNLARISGNIESRYERLGALYRLSLLELAKKNDNLSCRVTFIDNDSDNKIFISDFRELGYEYLKYKGENFAKCKECGILFRVSKNGRQQYCPKCAAKPPMETKLIECSDCGRDVIVSAKNNKSYRCTDCQQEADKKRKADWKRTRSVAHTPSPESSVN